jgi:tetratricopeptide repeat protein 8
VNLGLCTFHAGQYDLSMPCLERALAQCSGDGPLADVWYNIGTIGVMMGDGPLALQAFSLAVAADPAHAEARTNLGVLEARKGNAEAARAHYAAAQKAAPALFEPWYNGALLEWRAGDVAAAFELAGRALAAAPEHADSRELLGMARAALLSGAAAVEGV